MQVILSLMHEEVISHTYDFKRGTINFSFLILWGYQEEDIYDARVCPVCVVCACPMNVMGQSLPPASILLLSRQSQNPLLAVLALELLVNQPVALDLSPA